MASTNRLLVAVAGALTAAAGVVHVAAAAGHRGDTAVAVLFVVAAAAQIGAAGALAARPGRAALVVSAMINAFAAGAWLVSRLTGIPFIDGLAGPQPVGLQDLTAVVVEAVAVGAAVTAAGRRGQAPARGLSPVWAVAALPMVIGLTASHSHPVVADAPSDNHSHDARAGTHSHEARAGTHSHGGTGERRVALADDPVFSGADTSRASQAQLAAAKDLILRTRQAVTRQFPDEAAVVAAGYQSIGDGGLFGSFEHFVKAAYLADGRELDPERIESVVMERTPSGKRVVSGMFVLGLGKTLADVPDVAGELTAWHDHQNLCWDVTGLRLAGRLVNGRCVPAGLFLPTPPMLHVWLQDHPCGPFAGIEGHGTACRHGH